MNNKQIIKILKEDIKELQKNGFTYKIIKGLSCNNYFGVDLMAVLEIGINKSIREIKFKNKVTRDDFLKECEGLK